MTRWFGVRRFIYNKCLSLINQDFSLIKNTKELRRLVVNNDNYTTENTWMLDYNYDLRDEALRDLLKNFKSNLAKGDKFKVSYLSKKQNNTSISVLKKHWNKTRGFWTEVLSPKVLKCSELLPEQLEHDSRLIKSATGKYYLCIPRTIRENQTKKSRCIFIDPGVNPMMMCYSPEGKIYKIGCKDAARIYRLNHYLNKIRSKIDLSKNKNKVKLLRLAYFRSSETISNIINDFHRKVAKWLASNFDVIFTPKLNFHRMKKLNKKSKQVLMSLKHCSFVDALKVKTELYNSKTVVVNESYTSKTCSCCGYQNEKLGKSKVFACKDCGKVIDRDINGAINIMLRYFTKRVALGITYSGVAA